MRSTEFHEFLQWVSFKAWSSKDQQVWLGYKLWGHCPWLRERGRQANWGQTAWKQHTVRKLFNSWRLSLKASIHWDPSLGSKKLDGAIYLIQPLSTNRIIYGKQQCTTGCLICLHQGLYPCALVGLTFSAKFALVQARWAPPPEDKHKSLPTHI